MIKKENFPKTGILIKQFGFSDNDFDLNEIFSKDNIYFFATRLTKKNDVPNSNFMNCRKEITKTILRQMKVIE